jgi:hypothetical protein
LIAGNDSAIKSTAVTPSEARGLSCGLKGPSLRSG